MTYRRDNHCFTAIGSEIPFVFTASNCIDKNVCLTRSTR